ncbi:hypothetical protein BOTBODRAFT_147320 [Botryobasidium botryosum FD-172 SS1]|uniref:F-box domain-containing protein n=1 Tax=Botryobasidium botryosum (strain FD-172 SS1) TaxID=930990 RepID=A0A067M6T1_BOTB1|nr:hypothetical protein BOTBODRAFT_147320 [Botryobasidium botryosum FD-172 SS1]
MATLPEPRRSTRIAEKLVKLVESTPMGEVVPRNDRAGSSSSRSSMSRAAKRRTQKSAQRTQSKGKSAPVATINLFPSEIWLEILTIAIDSGSLGVLDLILVSPNWLALSRRIPSAWTTVIATNHTAESLIQFLARSRSLKVDIVIKRLVPNSIDGLAILNALAHCHDRLRSLDMGLSGPLVHPLEPAHWLLRPAHALERVDIHVHDPIAYGAGYVTLGNLFDGDTPNLLEVSFHSFPINLNRTLLHGLKSLHLSYSKYHITPVHLLDAVRMCPKIEEISLEQIILDVLVQFNIHPVNCPSLKILRIVGLPLCQTGFILASVIPSVTAQTVVGINLDEELRGLSDAFSIHPGQDQESFQNVRRVVALQVLLDEESDLLEVEGWDNQANSVFALEVSVRASLAWYQSGKSDAAALTQAADRMFEEVLRLPAMPLEGQINSLRVHHYMERPHDLRQNLRYFAPSLTTLYLYECSGELIHDMLASSGKLLSLEEVTIVRCQGVYQVVHNALVTRHKRLSYLGFISCGRSSQAHLQQLRACTEDLERDRQLF